MDMQRMAVDLLAAPGHKGLLGPLGTGILAVGSRAAKRIVPIFQGGTGTTSESLDHPTDWPQRLESGNPNYAAIAGLAAGVAWIRSHGVETIEATLHALTTHFFQRFRTVGLSDRARIVGPDETCRRTGVVSLAIEGYDPQEIAILLDQLEPRIQTRAGLHCAPLVHQTCGTFERGGTLRLSWGPLTTTAELDQAIAALAEILGEPLA
ncbi:MAG: aminotransferase class V-fold PLP-dependent enzyme [Pirellulales bacterium]